MHRDSCFDFVLGRVQTIWTDKQRDHHENLNDQSSTMACSSRETVSEDNDSDFDEASHEDDEQPNDKDSGTEQADEYQAQIIVRSPCDELMRAFRFHLDPTTTNPLGHCSRMDQKRSLLRKTTGNDETTSNWFGISLSLLSKPLVFQLDQP